MKWKRKQQNTKKKSLQTQPNLMQYTHSLTRSSIHPQFTDNTQKERGETAKNKKMKLNNSQFIIF